MAVRDVDALDQRGRRIREELDIAGADRATAVGHDEAERGRAAVRIALAAGDALDALDAGRSKATERRHLLRVARDEPPRASRPVVDDAALVLRSGHVMNRERMKCGVDPVAPAEGHRQGTSVS